MVVAGAARRKRAMRAMSRCCKKALIKCVVPTMTAAICERQRAGISPVRQVSGVGRVQALQ